MVRVVQPHRRRCEPDPGGCLRRAGRSGAMTRLAVGGLWHETNTFASPPTTMEDFQVLRGDEIPHQLHGTRTPIGGLLDCGPGGEVAPVPAGSAGGPPR